MRVLPLMRVIMYTIYINFKTIDSRDRIKTLDLCDNALKLRQDVLECMTKLFMSQEGGDVSEDAIKFPESINVKLTDRWHELWR